MKILFRHFPSLFLLLIASQYGAFCQNKSASFPKQVSTPRIPKKKDTVTYNVIFLSGDTMQFDMKRNLANEMAIHPYKAVWTFNKITSKLLFIHSDTVVATVTGNISKKVSDTSQVYNVWDMSSPWYLSIQKTYFVEVKNINLRTPIDAIENEKLRHWLKKVTESISSQE